MKTKIKNIITFSLIGATAYMFTDIIHEVIGHSGTCLMLGDKITLLTSVYFRSVPGNFIIDLGGPLFNLLFGILIFYILKRRKDLSVLTRLLFLLTMSYNFYLFSGTILQSSFSKTGDWAYTMKQLNIGMFGKALLILAGITAYYISIKQIKAQFIKINLYFAEFPLRQSIYYSYFAAAIVAVIAGLFFAPARATAAREGLLEMIASLPILFIGSRDRIKVEAYETKSRHNFNIIIFILFIVFCLTLGQGFIL